MSVLMDVHGSSCAYYSREAGRGLSPGEYVLRQSGGKWGGNVPECKYAAAWVAR